ncbi:MAG TPA: hypothetical protein VIS94_11085 [Desulfomonilia bacterium]
MLRKTIISLAVILFAAKAAMADGSKVIAVVPPGTGEVFLMSQGTGEVLSFIHGKYNSNIKSIQARYNLPELKALADKALVSSRSDNDAVNAKIKEIKNEYISKLDIKINKVKSFISPETSATGEIEFTYTAVNNSDRIIADAVYTPVIGKMQIQTSSKLVLDFVDRTTLKAGIAPGKSLITTEENSDSFSFLLGQMSKNDLAYVRENAEKGLSLKVTDIHFTNSVEYKDQSKILTAEQAFQDRLQGILARTSSENLSAQEDTVKYNEAKKEFDAAKSAALLEFTREAGELKKSAVRYSSRASEKGRAVFEGVAPGNYFVYASKDGQAVFKEISVKNRKLKVKANELRKDPFKP